MKAMRIFAASIGLCAVASACAGAASAQSITFFEYEGFGGRQVSSDQSIPNFDPLGMNDAANAIIVRYGQWEVCSDAFFHGRCETLSPGEYPNLGVFDLRNSISSARLVATAGGNARVIPAPVISAPPQYPPQAQYQPPPQYPPQAQYQPPPQYPPQAQYQPPPVQYQPPPQYPPPAQYQPTSRPPRGPQAPVMLYDEYDFGGNSTAVNTRVDNLDITQWNDRAVSMVISDGNWQLCTDAYYRGSCAIFGPGSYRDLGNGMAREVSSLRPADNNARSNNPDGYIPAPQMGSPQANSPGAWRGGLRAILFSDHDLRGANLVIDGDLPNLDGSRFNDRASSIRIEGGYWQFCSDAGYRGDCRTFGPGDYPNLSDGFEGKISSVRRVAGPGR